MTLLQCCETKQQPTNLQNIIFFHKVLKNRFVDAYWYGEGVHEMTDSTYK